MWHLGYEDDTDWQSVDPPISGTLHDVAQTTIGPHAVGSGGTLLVREDGEWHVGFDDGPAAENRELLTVAATDGGERIWFGGESGAFGCYDVTEGEKYDYSKPAGTSATLDALAVAGERGSEKLLVGGGGTIYPGYVDDCRPTWDDPVDVGDDGTVAALTADTDGYGYASTTNGDVYRTTANSGWNRIGVANTTETLPAIRVTSTYLWVGGASGRVYRYDRSGDSWTTFDVADQALRSFGGEGETMYVVGDAGTVVLRVDEKSWREATVPTNEDLFGAIATPRVVVGANGTIIESE